MSLTSYRAAPPRGGGLWGLGGGSVGGPGGALLFRALRRSTIGAEGFHGRVRDGIGCFAPRYGHQAGQRAVAMRVLGGGFWAPGREWCGSGLWVAEGCLSGVSLWGG